MTTVYTMNEFRMIDYFIINSNDRSTCPDTRIIQLIQMTKYCCSSTSISYDEEIENPFDVLAVLNLTSSSEVVDLTVTKLCQTLTTTPRMSVMLFVHFFRIFWPFGVAYLRREKPRINFGREKDES